MNRAERYFLHVIYPKTDLDKVFIAEIPEGIGELPESFLGSRRQIKIRKWVVSGKHRIWTMRVGRSSRRDGRDAIYYRAFTSVNRLEYLWKM